MSKTYEYKKRQLKVLRCFLMSAFFLLFCVFPAVASDGLMKMHFIDVGYGDAILIELPDGEAALIDSGPADYAGRLTEYLSGRDIKNFKIAILTHPHKDHFGGFLSLVNKWPIGKFYINGDTSRAEKGYDVLIKKIKGAGTPIIILKEGDELAPAEEDFRISVLNPSALERSANENALVLHVIFKDTSFFLTSDILGLQQERIIEHYPQVKTANIIEVSHHGRTITERFVGSFGDNSVFIVSTGANEHGKIFVEELDKFKGKVLRTDLHGSIEIQSDGHQVKVIHE
jgi:competence protein ComEC